MEFCVTEGADRLRSLLTMSQSSAQIAVHSYLAPERSFAENSLLIDIAEPCLTRRFTLKGSISELRRLSGAEGAVVLLLPPLLELPLLPEGVAEELLLPPGAGVVEELLPLLELPLLPEGVAEELLLLPGEGVDDELLLELEELLLEDDGGV